LDSVRARGLHVGKAQACHGKRLQGCADAAAIAQLARDGKALLEMHRTLRPGGKLLITVPFAYPFHDEVDYWRLSRTAYEELFKEWDVLVFASLGGRISTIVDNLQRPRGRLNARYLAYKVLGFFTLAALGRWDCMDGLPLGYGIYAEKR